MKVLVNPDIHGRQFWKPCISKINEYDKIIFLGDYLDPYGFENISVEDAIINFKDIIDFAKQYKDKVVLLLGNHDMPYYSTRYLMFSVYHSRHSVFHHKEIHDIFKKNKDLFKIAYNIDDILFTHAGCTPGWIYTVFSKEYKLTSIDDLVTSLNNLLTTTEGLKHLFMISEDRGGRDKYASCIWADATDTMWYQEMLKDPDLDIAESSLQIMKIKQVFGHTLQAFYDENRNIVYGDIIETMNNKMLDNCQTYILDTNNFTIEQL